ncbi:uncharacterized protein GGS25DRAFT_312255 [Hypoxylon fragiforme]|uniref:uncharacterized protein n=1 Tax=Hypoxylon fragiforme TaxID=63214 RepID=UPI0020C5BAE9|nr:uncharacterized protein GGS25DRAFT_312255 [Hypoxylon fragiforme]KAI2606903.1 hypothetical protein GGS25DRAFT_312255 [Hypoxylon fragiforme]
MISFSPISIGVPFPFLSLKPILLARVDTEYYRDQKAGKIYTRFEKMTDQRSRAQKRKNPARLSGYDGFAIKQVGQGPSWASPAFFIGPPPLFNITKNTTPDVRPDIYYTKLQENLSERAIPFIMMIRSPLSPPWRCRLPMSHKLPVCGETREIRAASTTSRETFQKQKTHWRKMSMMSMMSLMISKMKRCQQWVVCKRSEPGSQKRYQRKWPAELCSY